MPPAFDAEHFGARLDRSRIETRDGLALAGWHWRLAGHRARVVLVHGYGEHLGRYSHVLAALLAAGFECHGFDLRGHGESAGPRGHVPEFAAYRDDLARFTAHALGETGGPSVLLGHSLGGLICLSTLLHQDLPFEALVVSSPFLAPTLRLSPVSAGALRLGAKLLPRFSVSSGIDAEGLSRDPAVVAAYLEDPKLVSTFTLAWAAAALAAQRDVLERAPEITLPALFLLGDADPIADPDRGRAVFERLGSADRRLLVYELYRHEVFNEIGKERVIADLVGWLTGHFPAQPPPPA